ncbi:MAG: GNAT family N-acetyltransferase [Chloroflexi bacterium]|nr:MAG: GNAT family N-acetyltransferase [Chloroflexota bacterium]
MLTELALSQYPAVLPLFQPLDFNLVIRSVVEGHTPAWVYADDPTSSRAALLWDRQDALLIAGDSHDANLRADLGDRIRDHIVPDARARWIPELTLFYTPGWERTLPALLDGFRLQPAQRLNYRLPNGQWSQPVPLPSPAGFELRRIDDGLLVSHLAYLDQVRGWIDSFWHRPEDFLHTGFGFCALVDDQIASWCLTVFAAGSARELGLATVPTFRGRGLATRLAAACVEHALTHDIRPHWHC